MSEQKKILIIQTAFPGDAILTLPFIQELKKSKTGFSIEVLCIPATQEIFKASAYVDEFIVLDKKDKQKSIFSLIKFIKELRRRNYNIVYSLHRSLRSSLIVLGLNVNESYGFDSSSLKFVYKNPVKYIPSAHEVRRNLEFINPGSEMDNWRIQPEVKVSPESETKVSQYLAEKNISKFIAIAPGSKWETKKYPLKYFKEIITYFVQKKYQLVLIGGAEDKDLCSQLQFDNLEKVHNAAGNFSFIETVELLKSSGLLVCNDSAPTHLGMCADIPVLTIYCSTVPEFGFYPYNSKSDYISLNGLECKPCGIHGFNSCPLNTFDCGMLLYPQKVIEKAEKLIKVV